MKRAEALQQLSRDHHRALEVALKLRRATSEDAEEALSEAELERLTQRVEEAERSG